MKHSERFTNAVTKLYNAFHKGELDANSCNHCAVGNICNNKSEWEHLLSGYGYGSGMLTTNEKKIEKAVTVTGQTGYSPIEIVTIEKIFIDAIGRDSAGDTIRGTKEQQFKGLFAVVEYLCELDGIPNVMDYKELFETGNNSPKKELVEVFS